MKMRYGSIRYNTSSSQKICRMESSYLFYDESGYYCETLYKSRTGNYFIHKVINSEGTSQHTIIPIEEFEVEDYMAEYKIWEEERNAEKQKLIQQYYKNV